MICRILCTVLLASTLVLHLSAPSVEGRKGFGGFGKKYGGYGRGYGGFGKGYQGIFDGTATNRLSGAYGRGYRRNPGDFSGGSASFRNMAMARQPTNQQPGRDYNPGSSAYNPGSSAYNHGSSAYQPKFYDPYADGYPFTNNHGDGRWPKN